MKQYIKIASSVLVGVVLGGSILFGLNNLRTDHLMLGQVVTYINNQIQAQQMQMQASQKSAVQK